MIQVARGVGCVFSIHQAPSVLFLAFDRIMLLSPHGRTAYFGPRSGVIQHFENCGLSVPLHVNPAEWLLDLVTEQSRGDVIDMCNKFVHSSMDTHERDIMVSAEML